MTAKDVELVREMAERGHENYCAGSFKGCRAAPCRDARELIERMVENGAVATERDAARAELAAWYIALEELAKWPDLPKVPYGLRLDLQGKESILYVEPSRLLGLMKAIRKHARELLPTGVEAVQAWYMRRGLEETIRRTHELVPTVMEMEDVALAADVVENTRPDLRVPERLRAFRDRMRGKERA